MEPKEFGIVLGDDRVKVYTMKGTQSWRSYRAYVYQRGVRQPIKCCTFIHKKRKTAKACGERAVRQMEKEKT